MSDDYSNIDFDSLDAYNQFLKEIEEYGYPLEDEGYNEYSYSPLDMVQMTSYYPNIGGPGLRGEKLYFPSSSPSFSPFSAGDLSSVAPNIPAVTTPLETKSNITTTTVPSQSTFISPKQDVYAGSQVGKISSSVKQEDLNQLGKFLSILSMIEKEGLSDKKTRKMAKKALEDKNELRQIVPEELAFLGSN